MGLEFGGLAADWIAVWGGEDLIQSSTNRSSTTKGKNMSYSFSARGRTKEEAIAAVAAELDKVVAAQPIHAADRDQALATATAFVNVLPENGEKDVYVSVSGSVGWEGTYPDSHVIANASISANASLVKREETARQA